MNDIRIAKITEYMTLDDIPSDLWDMRDTLILILSDSVDDATAREMVALFFRWLITEYRGERVYIPNYEPSDDVVTRCLKDLVRQDLDINGLMTSTLSTKGRVLRLLKAIIKVEIDIQEQVSPRLAKAMRRHLGDERMRLIARDKSNGGSDRESE